MSYQARRRPNYGRPNYGSSPLLRSNRQATTLLHKAKRTAAVILCIALVAGAGIFAALRKHESPAKQQATSPTQAHTTTPGTAATQPTAFNKKRYSTTDASSLWVIVNKQHQLQPKDYTPANLVVPNIPLRSNITSTEKYVRADMGAALEKMVQTAASQGIHLNLQSGYRSYGFQVNLYNGYVKQQGQTSADRQSARPGYSEHQTGLAADLGGSTQPSCNVAQCFANTIEGKWLTTNAYLYGFMIRYTTAKESVTGYEDEPWHIRYVGADLAAELHTSGVTTLEEFFDVSGGTAY